MADKIRYAVSVTPVGAESGLAGVSMVRGQLVAVTRVSRRCLWSLCERLIWLRT